ncbi:hypothetical protein B0H14DRAFT_2602265 [Mycena olivaceomarginata]|nr:hypothetical protein B0H14DRAFT_2602265 [Mycena olivaceomarginata]
MRELVTTNPQCVLPLNEVVRLHKYFPPIPSQPQRSRPSTKLVTAPGAVPAALHFEVLKKLRLVQLISRGANPVYNELINTYPQNTERLHKEKQMFSSDRNVGLVTQAIDHVPPWMLKKPMATYVTLVLSDIVRVVGIQSEDEVRALGLSMISTSSTVTFSDRPPQISKDEVDTAVPRRYRGTRGPIHASYTTRPTVMGLPHALDPANGTNVTSWAARSYEGALGVGGRVRDALHSRGLSFNGSSSMSRASAHRVLGVICAVASVPATSAVGYHTPFPHPPDPRTAAADVAQVQAQVDAQVQAQAQAAADRSARDERGRARVVAHLSM